MLMQRYNFFSKIIGNLKKIVYICRGNMYSVCLTNLTTNLFIMEKKNTKTRKMFNEEEYELDNQYNDDERYSRSDSCIWYN